MSFAALISVLISVFPTNEITLIGTTDEGAALYLFKLEEETIQKIGPGNQDSSPRWSPDGQWIAFETDSEIGRGIGLVREDGSDFHIVSQKNTTNHQPRWSADSQKIAYSSGQALNEVIVVYDLESETESIWGGYQTGLLRPVWLETSSLLNTSLMQKNIVQFPEEHPRPSTGVLLAIGRTTSHKTQSTSLKLVTSEQCFSAPEQLLDTPDNSYVEWSAEPSKNDRAIAYESNDGGDREIFIAYKDKVFDVSNHHSTDWNPVWSPDGKWLVFESFRKKRWGLYRVHRDTSRIFVVADEEEKEFIYPTWSPDSQQIASIILSDGKHYLGVITKEGKLIKQYDLPLSLAEDPQWKPAP
jgi:dipeptidyl aminopeptidase/acylaminoacyl peptidase